MEREDIKNEAINEKRKIEQSIKEVIQLTSDITIQMKNMTEVDLSDESLKLEVFKNQESVIQSITSNLEDCKDCSWVVELRSHFVKILGDYLKLINKYVTLENNFYHNKVRTLRLINYFQNKFQQTSDKIAQIHEEEINKSKYKEMFTYEIT